MSTVSAPRTTFKTLPWICVAGWAIGLGGCAHLGSTPPRPAPAAPESAAVTTDPESLQSCRKVTVAFGAGAPNEDAPPTGNAVELLSMSPPEGRVVTPATVMIADVSYGVKSFVAGQLRLAAQFETLAGHSGDPLQAELYPVLNQSTGTVRFCVPMSAVLLNPTLKKPLTLRFELLKGADPGTHTVIARSEAVSFPTAP